MKLLSAMVCLLLLSLSQAAMPQAAPILKANIEQRIQLVAPMDLGGKDRRAEIMKLFQDAIKAKHPTAPGSVDCIRYALGVSGYGPSQDKLASSLLPNAFRVSPDEDPQDPQTPKGTNTCKRSHCTKTCKGKKGEETCESTCDYTCSGMPVAPGVANDPEVPRFVLPGAGAPNVCVKGPGL